MHIKKKKKQVLLFYTKIIKFGLTLTFAIIFWGDANGERGGGGNLPVAPLLVNLSPSVDHSDLSSQLDMYERGHECYFLMWSTQTMPQSM